MSEKLKPRVSASEPIGKVQLVTQILVQQPTFQVSNTFWGFTVGERIRDSVPHIKQESKVSRNHLNVVRRRKHHIRATKPEFPVDIRCINDMVRKLVDKIEQKTVLVEIENAY